MNFFELMVNLNHRDKTLSYVETTATFTGKRNIAGRMTKTGTVHEMDYYEYEIEYEAKGKLRRGFYSFYPLPDPEPDEIKGKTIGIRYNKRKPYLFEKTIS